MNEGAFCGVGGEVCVGGEGVGEGVRGGWGGVGWGGGGGGGGGTPPLACGS